MNSFDNIQGDEFISGDDFLLWVEAMESYEASRDEADRRTLGARRGTSTSLHADPGA